MERMGRCRKRAAGSRLGDGGHHSSSARVGRRAGDSLCLCGGRAGEAGAGAKAKHAGGGAGRQARQGGRAKSCSPSDRAQPALSPLTTDLSPLPLSPSLFCSLARSLSSVMVSLRPSAAAGSSSRRPPPRPTAQARLAALSLLALAALPSAAAGAWTPPVLHEQSRSALGSCSRAGPGCPPLIC